MDHSQDLLNVATCAPGQRKSVAGIMTSTQDLASCSAPAKGVLDKIRKTVSTQNLYSCTVCSRSNTLHFVCFAGDCAAAEA